MLPRLIIENIFPPAACNPHIRQVRFNVLHGLPIQQHNMDHVTEQLRVAAYQLGANPRRVYDAPDLISHRHQTAAFHFIIRFWDADPNPAAPKSVSPSSPSRWGVRLM